MPAKKQETKKEPTIPKRSLLEKALTPGEPELLAKDDVLDLIFWLRQIIGIGVGTAAGVAKFIGAPVMVAYGVLVFGLTFLYTSRFLQVDD